MKKIVLGLLLMCCLRSTPKNPHPTVHFVLNFLGTSAIIQGSTINIPIIGSLIGIDKELHYKKLLFGASCLIFSRLLRLMEKPVEDREEALDFTF